TSTLAAPTTPITPTRIPAAGSTISQAVSNVVPGAASVTAASVTAAAAETAAPAIATGPIARRGAAAATAAVTAGSSATATASSSRLVTQAPQGGDVAGAELREDPLVEHDGDGRDQRQVAGDAQLDRSRGAGVQLQRRQRETVLDEHDPEHLEQRRGSRRNGDEPEGDERQHAALGVARDEPERRHEPRERQRERDRESAAQQRGDAASDRTRLARPRHDQQEQHAEHERA